MTLVCVGMSEPHVKASLNHNFSLIKLTWTRLEAESWPAFDQVPWVSMMLCWLAVSFLPLTVQKLGVKLVQIKSYYVTSHNQIYWQFIISMIKAQFNSCTGIKDVNPSTIDFVTCDISLMKARLYWALNPLSSGMANVDWMMPILMRDCDRAAVRAALLSSCCSCAAASCSTSDMMINELESRVLWELLTTGSETEPSDVSLNLQKRCHK